jgi:hypothetical protein
MSSYYYRQSEPNLWTVGIDCGDDWFAESDHSTPEAAAQRVHWLNGGSLPNAPQPSREREALDRLKYAWKIVLEHGDLDTVPFDFDDPEAKHFYDAMETLNAILSESEVGDES